MGDNNLSTYGDPHAADAAASGKGKGKVTVAGTHEEDVEMAQDDESSEEESGAEELVSWYHWITLCSIIDFPVIFSVPALSVCLGPCLSRGPFLFFSPK